MTFLKFIRYHNLIILSFSLFLLQQILRDYDSLIHTTLSDLNLSLYILSSSLILAGGYIINDIHNLKADLINKPHKVYIGKSITRKEARFSYWVLSLLGVVTGLYVCNELNSHFNAILCLLTFALLYVYSFSLKKKPIVGNLVISLLYPISLFAIYMFKYNFENFYMEMFQFYMILPYLFFTFLINLMREMIKDLKDTKGDYNAGYKTLPILIGKKRTRNVVLILNAILLITIIFIMKVILQNKYGNSLFTAVLVMVLIPSSILFYRLWSAKKKKEFGKVSQLLKIILVLGILTMLFINF